MILVKYIVYLLRFILSKSYRNNQVYRPTELLAFQNIERENKVRRNYGITPHFTEFEKKIYAIDLYLKQVVIPKAVSLNSKDSKRYRVPNALHEIADVTAHSPDFIKRVLEDIEDKCWLRHRIDLEPIHPISKGYDFEKMYNLTNRIDKDNLIVRAK